MRYRKRKRKRRTKRRRRYYKRSKSRQSRPRKRTKRKRRRLKKYRPRRNKIIQRGGWGIPSFLGSTLPGGALASSPYTPSPSSLNFGPNYPKTLIGAGANTQNLSDDWKQPEGEDYSDQLEKTNALQIKSDKLAEDMKHLFRK